MPYRPGGGKRRLPCSRGHYRLSRQQDAGRSREWRFMETGGGKRTPSITQQGRNKAAARRARQAEALRENLRKRKRQQRARGENGGGAEPRREG